MFISEAESDARLRDPRNVLARVDRSSDESPLSTVLPAPIIPVTSTPDLLPEPAAEPNVEGLRDASASTQIREIDPTVELKMRRIIEGSNARAGRKPSIRNRTVPENGAIGLTTLLLGGRAAEEMFGTQQPENSILSRGYTSPQAAARKSAKDELLDEIYSNGKEVQSRAFAKLLKSLDLVDDEKLTAVKDPAKLVGIAKNLSGIIKDVTPKEGGNDEAGVHFHIYRPEQLQESDYETLEVGADGTVTGAE